MIFFKVVGLESLTSVVTLHVSMKSVVTVSFHQIGRKIETYIKRKMITTSRSDTGASVPGAFPASQTGQLRSSIDYKVKGWDTLEIRGQAPYSGFLEFGTGRMAARPFIEPGIRDNIKFAEMTIATNLRRAFGL